MTYRATQVRTLALAGAALFAAQAATAEPFNGPYVGAELGWQQDRLKATLSTGGIDFSATEKGSGLAYGGVLGWDFKLADTFVVGGEVSTTGDSGKLDFGGFEADAGRTLGIAARAGFLATPQTLVYARGGWVNGRFSFDDGVDRASQNRDGWTVGGGIEQMLSENVSAKVEYRYAKFNSFRADPADLGGDDLSARFSRNQIMAGVNYRF